MPTFAERVSDWVAGAPLGSRPFTRTEPYTEFMEERKRRGAGLNRIFAFLVITLLALAMASTAFAAEKGYWSQVAGSAQNTTASPGTTDANTTYAFKWTLTDGSTPEKIKRDGRETENSVRGRNRPDWVPDGYELDRQTQDDHQSTTDIQGTTPSEAAGEQDLSDKKISEEDPQFALTTGFFVNSFIKIVWTLCRSVTELVCDMSAWFMGLIGENAESAFTADFSTGTFSGFYRAAEQISRLAFQPYGLAFLGLAFGLALVKPFDPRRRMRGPEQFAQVLSIIAMLAVSATLVLHAMEVCGAIYWLAQNLVRGVSKIIAGLGLSPAGGAGALTEAFTKQMDALTYSQGGASVVIMLLSFVALVVCAGCAFSIISTIFLRVGEIYLRASASPICLALLVDNDTRRIGIGYIKRFGAVCAQAVMIFVALGFMPLFFEVASTFIAPMTGTASSISGVGGILASVIPTLCAVFAAKQVVARSEQVANSLFGLA